MVPVRPATTKVLFAKVTNLRLFEVPEVLEVHEVPSEEVRMVPESPVTTKVLLLLLSLLLSLLPKTLLVSFKNELLS